MRRSVQRRAVEKHDEEVHGLLVWHWIEDSSASSISIVKKLTEVLHRLYLFLNCNGESLNTLLQPTAAIKI